MKRHYLLYIPLILLASCTHELSRNEAFRLLEKEYPKELYYQVFTADRNHARKMEQEGLVTAGLVTINPQAPYIYFTNNANKLLLPTPDFDKNSRKIQRVKSGEYHLVEITGIKGNDKKAAVEYTFELRNLTSFSKLHNKPLKDKEQKTKTAYFIRYDDGWRIDKSEGLEYLFE